MGLSRRSGKRKKEDEGAPAWMVTFADLMTLLLTFFVLLLSMSTLDNQKVKLALGSLRGALGVLEGGGQPREGRKELSQVPRLAQGEMELMTTIERIVETVGLDRASFFEAIEQPAETIMALSALVESLLAEPAAAMSEPEPSS